MTEAVVVDVERELRSTRDELQFAMWRAVALDLDASTRAAIGRSLTSTMLLLARIESAQEAEMSPAVAPV